VGASRSEAVVDIMDLGGSDYGGIRLARHSIPSVSANYYLTAV
jgi:hypothetical protein